MRTTRWALPPATARGLRLLAREDRLPDSWLVDPDGPLASLAPGDLAWVEGDEATGRQAGWYVGAGVWPARVPDAAAAEALVAEELGEPGAVGLRDAAGAAAARARSAIEAAGREAGECARCGCTGVVSDTPDGEIRAAGERGLTLRPLPEALRGEEVLCVAEEGWDLLCDDCAEEEEE